MTHSTKTEANARSPAIRMISALRKLFSKSDAPVVFQYWDQSPPPEIANWMQSWCKVEPDFKLEQFDSDTAASFIQLHIGARAEAAYRMCRAPAMKSDFFRYCALFARGGIYADADTAYKGDLASLYELGSSGLLLRRTKGVRVRLTNSFMIVRHAGNPLLEYAIDSAMKNIHAKRSQSVWEVTGPGVLRQAYNSERRADFFSGFAILQMHSTPVKRVIAFQKGEYKKGERDWRRMKEAGVSIYQENSDAGVS